MEQLARLCAKTQSYDVGYGGKAELTQVEVAGCLAGLSEETRVFAMAKGCQSPAEMHAVLSQIRQFLLNRHPKASARVRHSLAVTLYQEIMDINICLHCNGTGFVDAKECSYCDGTGRFKFTERHLKEKLNISTGNYHAIYKKTCNEIRQHFAELEAVITSHILKKLKSEASQLDS